MSKEKEIKGRLGASVVQRTGRRVLPVATDADCDGSKHDSVFIGTIITSELLAKENEKCFQEKHADFELQ